MLIQALFSVGQSDEKVDSLEQILLLEYPDSTIIKTRLALFEIYFQQDKTKAKIHLSEAESLAKVSNEPAILAEVFKSKGYFELRSNQFSAALENYLLAGALYEKAGDNYGVCTMLNMAGTVHMRRGNYFEAIIKYKKVISIIDKLNRPEMYETVYNNLGVVYFQLEKYELAEYYYKKSLEESEKSASEDVIKTAYYYNNMAEVYLKQNRLTEARMLFMKSVEMQRADGHVNLLSLEYNNLAKVYLEIGQMDSSLSFLEKAMFTAQDFNNEYDLANTYLIWSEWYLAQGDFGNAKKMANKSMSLAKKSAFTTIEIDAHELYAKILQTTGEFDGAYENLTRAKFLEDSLRKLGDEFELLEVEYNFDSEERLEAFTKGQNTAVISSVPFWENDWFLISVFFILAAALIIIVQYLERKYKTYTKNEFGNVDYLRSNRFLWIVAGIFYTLVPIMIPSFSSELFDPLWIRLTFTGGHILFVSRDLFFCFHT